jgi:hypothetical protein
MGIGLRVGVKAARMVGRPVSAGKSFMPSMELNALRIFRYFT